jgi:hypothetical protein
VDDSASVLVRLDSDQPMGMREIRVYDGNFPAVERLLAGDPTVAPPKEIWLSQVEPGEFAVRYKDFKTGQARNPAGKPVRSSEICRVFSGLEEARANSREVVNEHWIVRCFIYDHTGSQVGTISNNKEVNKFAAAAYVAILLWVGFFSVVGMGLMWMLWRGAMLLLGPFYASNQLLPSLGWLGWVAYAFAGLLVGSWFWYLRIRFIAGKRVGRLHAKLESVVSPEEKEHFEQLNTLHGSEDPNKRERFLELYHEYQNKLGEVLKK